MSVAANEQRKQKIVAYVRKLSRQDGMRPESMQIGTGGVAIPSALEGFHLSGDSDITACDYAGLAAAPPGAPVTKPGMGVVPQQPVITQASAESLDRALRGKPISDSDAVQLESIILPAMRPAFDIVSGSYATLPATWDIWNTVRSAAEPLLRGIGRLQLAGHPTYTFVGTGFVCGTNAILTNRHVAQIFVEGIASGMQLNFTSGVTCAMDTLAEVGSSAALILDVSVPVAISTKWDVALLRVNSLPVNVAPLPLASAPPPTLQGGDAGVVGYPAFDPYESISDQLNIFRGVFDHKRLQPGKLNGQGDVLSFGSTVSGLAHDCSTLGGNSGSALLCANTMQVVGIHFSGITHVSNYAVPAWELVHDPAFSAQQLNFV